MKTVLMLTDFSRNASHAAISASSFVSKLKADVFIYHTYYDSSLILAYGRGSMIIDEFALLEKESVTKIKELASGLQDAVMCSSVQDFQPEINSQCNAGCLGDNVARILKEKQIEMIVMGANAKSNIHNLFFGSDTLSVIEKSTRPAGFDHSNNCRGEKHTKSHIRNNIRAGGYQCDSLSNRFR